MAGAAVLYVIASGRAGFTLEGGFASNGYAEHSPGGYSLAAGATTEVVMTFMFVLIILGATDGRAPRALPRSPSVSASRSCISSASR